MDALSCPLCDSADLKAEAASAAEVSLDTKDFRITDAGYGRTGPLYRCRRCRFLFVHFQKDVLPYYQAMDDPQYEEGRAYRSVQQERLIGALRVALPQVTAVLDVGAGTGMLVEVAARQGLQAVGIEPCHWSVEVARQRGLEVYEGVLPHPALDGRLFDAVTLIDIIEHVPDPVGLLRLCVQHLRPGGSLLVVTPDVNSVVPRLMGSRWWHFRLAHIGYFSRETLQLALRRAGLAPVSITRPTWYFEIGYLYERLRQFAPLPARERLPNGLAGLFSVQIPINFRDSLEIIARLAIPTAVANPAGPPLPQRLLR